MDSHRIHTIGVCHDRCRNALQDYKRETMIAVNYMLREVTFNLRTILDRPLTVTFGESGGPPVIRYGDTELHVTCEGMKDANDSVYPELAELAAAVTTAEMLTLSYTIGIPQNLNF